MNNSFPILDLYQQEVETHGQVISEGILALESNKPVDVEALMRAAHSLKGAARILELSNVEKIAHLLEDLFIELQNNQIEPKQLDCETLLKASDYLNDSGTKTESELTEWLEKTQGIAQEISKKLKQPILHEKQATPHEKGKAHPISRERPNQLTKQTIPIEPSAIENYTRVSIKQLNELMGMLTENLTYAYQLEVFQEKLKKLKKKQNQIIQLVDKQVSGNKALKHSTQNLLQEMHHEIEIFEVILKQNIHLSNHLHQSVLKLRMRPFKDGTSGFTRMVRDISKELNKKIKLTINGENTPIDRDILSKLEAPLTHIIRNACDHGIEEPELRKQLNKPDTGTIVLSSYHEKGMLVIEIKDDGRGIDIDKIREKIIQNKQIDSQNISTLTKEELLEFIFLPNFSTQEKTTKLSGRGVGLDVVQTFLSEIGGKIQLETEYTKGSSFKLKTPITRSTMKVLLVMIHQEIYALSLNEIKYINKISSEEIFTLKNRLYFKQGSSKIGLIWGKELLEGSGHIYRNTDLLVVVLEDEKSTYGLVVDKFLGEEEIIIRSVHKILEEIPLVNGATIDQNGQTVLILNSKDILIAANKTFIEGKPIQSHAPKINQSNQIHILVVDDSITVRETERRTLEDAGYWVETAVDGMDGWHTLQLKKFNLLISDIDMPRLNGYELIERIRKTQRLKNLPIMIVSYKNRSEDVKKALSLGANCYLSKNCLRDDSFIKNIEDLTKQKDS